jgi:hypothetical protein
MRDFIDERVREAFMEFRDEAQGEILARGSAAARSTANHRRRIGTAIAVCGLAAVLVGAWVALRPPTGPAPVAADPTTTAPSPADYERSLSAAFARAQFGDHDPEWATIPTSPIWWGPTGTQPVERTFRYPGSPPGAGVAMTAACAGTGSVSVLWRTERQSAEIPLFCEEDGVLGQTLISPVTPDETIDAVEVTVLGDAGVTPEGAFVVIMTDPHSLAAQALLGPPPSAESLTGTGTTYNPFGSGGTTSQRVGPGRYRLTLLCVGDPAPEVETQIRVQFSLAAGDLVGQHTACPPEGGRIDLEASSSTETVLLVSIHYSGSFGYAYHIVRTEAAS